MGRIAVVGGSSIRGVEIDAGDAVLIQRHGEDAYRLPDRIDHVANMRFLRDAGCDRVIALGSVGGLRADLGPGTVLCPADFIALGRSPSAFDDERAHQVPGFDLQWRGNVVAAWGRCCEPTLIDGGVYWQTAGPRLETAAEIRLISAHAEVVGMTIGSECAAAGELGLAYAAICVVDNLANGIGDGPLGMEELVAARAANVERLREALAALLPELTGMRRP
jgi:5'-methylthioadenosine phosphorylase